MKRIVLLAVCALFMLTSCKTQVTQYENLLDDLDFEYRFEELCEGVEKGEDSSLFLSYISTLRDELAAYEDEQEEINDINDLLVKSMDKLMVQAVENTGNPDEAHELYEQGMELWTQYKRKTDGGRANEF